MYTDVQVINLGFAKIGSSRIKRIDPPGSALERFAADGYEHWKRSELAKHKWVFAREDEYVLTKLQDGNSAIPLVRADGRNYRYVLPVECLRPIRTKHTEWIQRGREIFSAYDKLKLDFMSDKKSHELEEPFVEVLAWRIAREAVEFDTQSNTKKVDTNALYKDQLAIAKNLNAFTVGPEDVSSDDEDFSFITSRFC